MKTNNEQKIDQTIQDQPSQQQTNINYNYFDEGLLLAIYHNCKMAIHAINTITNDIENFDLLELVDKQKHKYNQIISKCINLSKKVTMSLTDINVMLKMMSYLSIKRKTFFNNSASKIADMLIQGTTMGITTIITDQNKNKKANATFLTIARDLQTAQEEFVDSLKTFL